MQAHNTNNQTGGGANDEALQVLATFASNATRSADDQSTSSLLTNGVMANLEHDNTNKRSMSSNSNHNNNAGSEEDEGSSRSSGSSSSRDGGVSKRTGLRKGKWTVEEEEYATRFIHYFSSGLLALPEGKTLRASLAEKLNCDPMRITKKYAGASCLGNKISKLCDRPKFSPHDIDMARLEISRLERRYHLRLAQGGASGAPLPKESGSNGVVDGRQHTPQEEAAAGEEGVKSPLPSMASHPSNTVQAADTSFVHQHQTEQYHTSNTNNNSGGVQGAPVGSFPQVNLTAVHQAPTPTTAQPTQAAQAVTTTAAPPFLSSYLATLANNAQLAASTSTLPPNVAQVLAAPQQQQPPVVKQQQQQVQQQQLNPQGQMPPSQQHQVATPVPALPAMTWPNLLLQGGVNNQVGVNSAAAPTTSLPQPQATAANNQLVNALLLQISTHLQVLATLSPETMKQIQLQILMTTLSPQVAAATLPAAQQAAAPSPPLDNNNIANLLANFQQLAQSSAGLPSTVAPVQGLPQNLLSLANNMYGISAPGVASNVNTSQSTASAAPAVSNKPTAQKVVQHHRAASSQGSVKSTTTVKRKRPVATQVANKVEPAASATPNKSAANKTTANTMAEYLNKLRQGHAEALERVRLEQAGDSGATSRSSSSLTNSSEVDRGPTTKKQKQDANNGIVALLPFEHATTISSGSGCTTNDSNGSSSSSIENLPTSDETRNDGSTSSNTMSEEDETEQEQQMASSSSLSTSMMQRTGSSVPPRKRFRSEGITMRNLADHNVRMAEEMNTRNNNAAP